VDADELKVEKVFGAFGATNPDFPRNKTKIYCQNLIEKNQFKKLFKIVIMFVSGKFVFSLNS
jgi:hypothetical protein